MPGGSRHAWVKGQHRALLPRASKEAHRTRVRDGWHQPGMRRSQRPFQVWYMMVWGIKYVLCFSAKQMVNKIFSKHATSSPRRGDWLVQNRVIAVEGTNCEWQEAAGKEATICFLWQSQRPELGTACICSRPRALPQRTVESVIKGLL